MLCQKTCVYKALSSFWIERAAGRSLNGELAVTRGTLKFAYGDPWFFCKAINLIHAGVSELLYEIMKAAD